MVRRRDSSVEIDLSPDEAPGTDDGAASGGTRDDIGQVTPAMRYGGLAGSPATDGSVALVPYYGDEEGFVLVALDLADGHVVWGPRGDEDVTDVLAVGGHLVATARSGTQIGEIVDETQENVALLGLAG